MKDLDLDTPETEDDDDVTLTTEEKLQIKIHEVNILTAQMSLERERQAMNGYVGRVFERLGVGPEEYQLDVAGLVMRRVGE